MDTMDTRSRALKSVPIVSENDDSSTDTDKQTKDVLTKKRKRSGKENGNSTFFQYRTNQIDEFYIDLNQIDDFQTVEINREPSA